MRTTSSCWICECKLLAFRSDICKVAMVATMINSQIRKKAEGNVLKFNRMSSVS